MDREAIRLTLINLLEDDTGERPEALRDEMHLRRDVGLDSVDLVSMISQVERKFRIRLSQEEMQGLETVGDVLTLLDNKMNPPLAA